MVYTGRAMLFRLTACTHLVRCPLHRSNTLRLFQASPRLPSTLVGHRSGGMPMRRATSNDLPTGTKLPTQADGARGQKQKSRWGVWDFYMYNLKTQPVLTKALTCFFGEPREVVVCCFSDR